MIMPAMQHFLSEIWKKWNGEAMNTNVDHASHELDSSKFESKLPILYLLWPFENCSNMMNGSYMPRIICYDLNVSYFLR